MIKVTITSTDVRNMQGTSKTTQRPYDLHFQTAWIHTVDRAGNQNPYPEKVELMLDKTPSGAVVPHPVGEYTTSPASILVDRGHLVFKPVLTPSKKSASTPSPIAA
jgi:hypothetical protein